MLDKHNGQIVVFKFTTKIILQVFSFYSKYVVNFALQIKYLDYDALKHGLRFFGHTVPEEC